MGSPRSLAAPARRLTRSLAATARTGFAAASMPARGFHAAPARRSGASPSNPAMAFPCLDAMETRSQTLMAGRSSSTSSSGSGPEPSYTSGATQTYHCKEPLELDWGGVLPEFTVAYESWGEINADRSNVILLHTGLSASSHAHSTPANPQPGWWEKFIGPGGPLDTDKYHVICTNVIGGCYGSTGPGSVDPANGERYATRFPVLTMQDMVRAQFRLLDGLGVDRLYASVGSSMGGMQSLAAGVLFPSRVGRIASISGCARSHPYSIAMRHTQRQVLMMDPNWNRGFYYDGIPPHAGMKLAREIATVTYRSGPEWEQRFGRRRADPSKPPALCPDFLIETYLDHAGEKWCLTYDPNSLLYVSKAMDLFDLGRENQVATQARRAARQRDIAAGACTPADAQCNLTLPATPYEEQPGSQVDTEGPVGPLSSPSRPPYDLVLGLAPLRDIPTLVMGVASDILFPAWQQREVAEAVRLAGNRNVTHMELSEEMSLFGHDTFLLDLEHVGGNLRMFLN
ncbi:Homoserine O-acetyltransferase [Purpureocillium takamizusanense]|uniref:Homoserine O-acetyltransferase n=1 Tax=Purpureocillium takamizusanense TaxID=2060973 RepID=A0A9Q8VB35_9HYPO|nr:Homoserine O-acetyltransferase [Purpureocillium takamizusanense]UNI18486.1 Homoserine O-acetyltransferase [Purpureocillium takamizusanense]